MDVTKIIILVVAIALIGFNLQWFCGNKYEAFVKTSVNHGTQ